MARAGNRRGAPAVNYSTGCQPLSELSSIHRMDRIVVVTDGQMVEGVEFFQLQQAVSIA
jgi:hypothetical protein